MRHEEIEAEAERRKREYHQNRQFREAAEAREAWAKAHGCTDFKQAMQVGLVFVGKRAQRAPEATGGVVHAPEAQTLSGERQNAVSGDFK
jgi:hypothetical protein